MTHDQSMLQRTTCFYLSWIVVAINFVTAAITLPQAPATIPTHWGMDGKPDAMGSALFGLSLVPAIAIALQVLALFLPYIDPGRKNYPNFQKAYWRIFFAIQAYLLAVQVLLCAAALGWQFNMSTVMPILVGSLLIVLGNYFGKLRPNWMVGIRTPWTLSSKLSWDKTHRLGGWLMMLMGLVFAGLAFIHTPVSFIAVGIFSLLCISFMVVYSWYVWRNDPDRIAASSVSAVEPDKSSGSPTLTLCLAVGASLLWTAGEVRANDKTADTTTTSIELKTESGNLSANLDMPSQVRGSIPVVLVLPGSGPTDSDGNSAGTRNDSLKLLGNALAANGIAACRVDKRGVGRSAAAVSEESDLRFETYIADAAAWIKLLKSDERFSQVHVLGHSEGSLIGIIAAEDTRVASIISVAGTGRTASDLMRAQLKTKIAPAGMQIVESTLKKLESGEQVTDVSMGLQVLFRPSVQPYLISWFRYDPVKEIANHKSIPVLIVQGTTDIQCSLEDAELLANGLPSAKKELITGMNHVLKRIDGETVQSQMVAYTDPSLPLHEELVPTIVDFIRTK